MEQLLDLYSRPYNPKEPVVGFDESSVQLLGEVRDGMPAQPGQTARYDCEYVRGGTANLLMAVEPLAGWRNVEVSETRTKLDFARRMKYLSDERYPEADVIHVILDNLNTHTLGALYEAFPAAEAFRIAQRIEFHLTPVHASWLNVTEIELSVLSRECLSQRIPTPDALTGVVDPWQCRRNDAEATIDWRFSVTDARDKFKRFYPN
jgi:hypothetical protein